MNLQKFRVYLNEYNVLMEKTTYLPLVSGLLRSYAEKFLEIREYYQFMPFLFMREPLENVLSYYDDPSVAAFSVFMWNEQLSLKIAEEIKRRYPQCLIVFGGQQVPAEATEYLEQYPFVDVAVRGEGEAIFAELLQQMIVSRDFSAIPDITWRNVETQSIHSNPPRTALEMDLDIYPSPYTNGIFDDLMKAHSQINFQAIIQTNRGCPFTCAYCAWHKSSKLRLFSMERVAAEIEWCGKNRIAYVFNADANFGIHPRDIEVAKILAETKLRHGFPEKFRSCFTKNADDRIYELAMLLLAHKLEKGITLSFQTLSEVTLRNIRRENIRLSTYKNLLARFNAVNVPVYTELILGLPGETTESWITGIEQILSSGLRGQLFVYPCEIYPNSEMGDAGYRERFGIHTRRILLTEIHGAVRDEGLLPEYQEIIVATASLPFEEWREMMIVSWLTMTLFSLKLGYFFLAFLRHRYAIPTMRFIQHLMGNERASVIRSEMVQYRVHLENFLTGETGRGVAIREYGDIYWDVEEGSFLRIVTQAGLFFKELGAAASQYCEINGIPCNRDELEEAIRYQSLLIPTPEETKSGDYIFQRNFPEYFSKLSSGKIIDLVNKRQILHVSGTDFGYDRVRYGREVLLWGRKSDSILSPAKWSDDKGPY